MASRTRRSLQYAPADQPNLVQSAASSKADGIIIDLESTVEESNKDDARENLHSYIEEVDFGEKEIVVRINDLRSDRWLTDLQTAIEAGTDTVRLPKIEESDDIKTAVEAARQSPGGVPEFLIQLESPLGLMNGDRIAKTCAKLPKVTGIGVGIGDYTTALGRDEHTSDLQAFVLNMTAAYAAIGNMDPLAYVHKDYEDLRSAAERAKALGHVGQPVSYKVDSDRFIDVLNDVYSE